MNKRARYVFRYFAVEQASVSHAERLVSGLGGLVAIACIMGISRFVVGEPAAALLVASMGASAVLLFAVPHGPLSQPWPLIGGHIISALIGVACAKLIPNEWLAASTAVGLAIGVMYYLRCVHPPGGATALVSVVGGDVVHELGFQFVLTPVALNVVVILAVAILFNYAFKWRRYPVYLHQQQLRKAEATGAVEEDATLPTHADFTYALSQIDSFVDVSEEELERIYVLARHRARERSMPLEDIALGGAYSNGEYGKDWSVRQVVDESPDSDADKHQVIYKVVAGKGRRSSGCVSRSEFARWAKHRVERDEENWKRVPMPNSVEQ